MTPLRFRAFDKADRKMFAVDLWMQHFSGSVVIGGAANDKRYHRVNLPEREPEVVVMRSTGMTDTHDTEIFEGDVLEFDSDREAQANGLYLLEWWDEYSRWILRPITNRLTDEHSDTAETFLGGEGLIWLSVVGNRYQNPELLHPQNSINAARVKKGLAPTSLL